MSVETLLKIVPKFDGNSSAIEWLYKFEASIDLLNVPAEQILSYIILFLEGDAYLWYSCVLEFVMFDDLDAFREQFLRWFASPTEKIMDSLSRCHFDEESSFRDYIMRQSKLFSRLNQLLDDVAKIQWFIRGLPTKWRSTFLAQSFKHYEDLAYFAISLDKDSISKYNTDVHGPRESAPGEAPHFVKDFKLVFPKGRRGTTLSLRSEQKNSHQQAHNRLNIFPFSTAPPNPEILKADDQKHLIVKACRGIRLSRDVLSRIKLNSSQEKLLHQPLVFDVYINNYRTIAAIDPFFKQSTISYSLIGSNNVKEILLETSQLDSDDCKEIYTAKIKFSENLIFQGSFQVDEEQNIDLILGLDFLTESRAYIDLESKLLKFCRDYNEA